MRLIAVSERRNVMPIKPFAPAELGDLAVSALCCEALLTPKPGLVDQRSAGAHHDLSLALLLKSAESLRPAFVLIAEAASGRSPLLKLREELGRLGRAAERRMLSATNGINTHRGAIWAIGLLVAGCTMAGEHASVDDVVAQAAALAALPDRFAPTTDSNGRRALRLYGGHGAREEACRGFPHVFQYGWPALEGARREGASEDEAQLLSLLAIMTSLNDTCVLHRGGCHVLQCVQQAAGHAYRLGATRTAMGRTALMELETLMIAVWASPGGSADLLAATLFMDRCFAAEGLCQSQRQEDMLCRN